MMKPVERHDCFSSNCLLGMREKFDDDGQNGGNRLVVDEAADGVQRRANNEVVIRLEILLYGVNDEDDEVVIVAEEERDGEVASAFGEEIVVVSHFHGVDVTERGVVAEHLDVEEAYDVLFHLPFRDVRLGDAAFEGFDFAEDDAVLLRLGSGFADGLDEVEKLLGLTEPALGTHGELAPDRL